MKTANQLTFTTYEASLKLKPNDPTKIIFNNIDWSFIHRSVSGRYSPQGAEGYDPVSLFKAQLLIYLGEASSDRKLASALGYNARLCLLCGFNFLKTPSHGTFTNFCDRLGEDIFYEIRRRLKFRCPAALGRCQCLFGSTCSLSPYGKTFYLHPERDYRLIAPIPRGSDIWQEKYNARTSVERAYSEEKGSHRLANPRLRGLAKVKIHTYLALSAQVIKRIGAMIMERLTRPHPIPYPVRA